MEDELKAYRVLIFSTILGFGGSILFFLMELSLSSWNRNYFLPIIALVSGIFCLIVALNVKSKNENEFEGKERAKENLKSAKKELKSLKKVPSYEEFISKTSADKDLKTVISEYKKDKKIKKNRLIALLVSLIVVVITVVSIAAYVNDAPYRKLKADLESGQLSSDLTIKQEEKYLQAIADKLHEYHENNDIKSALNLLEQLQNVEVHYTNNKGLSDSYHGLYYGGCIYASYSFMSWIENCAAEKGEKKSDEFKNYKLYEYEITCHDNSYEEVDSILIEKGDILIGLEELDEFAKNYDFHVCIE